MARFTSSPAFFTRQGQFLLKKYLAKKKHEGIYEQYPYSFDFLLVLMDTGQ